MTGEFDIIRRYFAPLASSPDALGLRDDAACLMPAAGEAYAISCDMLVEGRHFRSEDAPWVIASRALRSNLSDLAAMGARPVGYFLSLALPDDIDDAWLSDFSKRLLRDQELFDLSLLGGDTVATPGPLTVSITIVGAGTPAGMLKRANASDGEDVYVSGAIGDGGLGLRMLLEGREGSDVPLELAAIARYQAPEPRLSLGTFLAGNRLASAAADVSDGLIADLGHICSASNCGAELRLADIPLSDLGRSWAGADVARIADLAAFGDDYELVFTAPSSNRDLIDRGAERLGIPVSRVGRLGAGPGVALLDAGGKPVDVDVAGYSHF